VAGDKPTEKRRGGKHDNVGKSDSRWHGEVSFEAYTQGQSQDP
jgi:hypothetical protein